MSLIVCCYTRRGHISERFSFVQSKLGMFIVIHSRKIKKNKRNESISMSYCHAAFFFFLEINQLEMNDNVVM